MGSNGLRCPPPLRCMPVVVDKADVDSTRLLTVMRISSSYVRVVFFFGGFHVFFQN